MEDREKIAVAVAGAAAGMAIGQAVKAAQEARSEEREVAESNPEDIEIAVEVEDDKGEVIADTELRVQVDEEGNIYAEEQIDELKRKLAELEAKQ